MESLRDSEPPVGPLDASDPARRPPRWPQVLTDYSGALVRLATMRAGGKQHLLFGYVELFPRDLQVPARFTAGPRPWAVPDSGGGVTLAASALPMATADALAWYEAAAGGRVTIPLSAPPVEIAAPVFGAEPALGRFCVGGSIPFSAPWHDGPRVHRLVPMEDPAEAVQRLESNAAAREWLAANAGFDPFEYEEWLGSLSMLAPDPLLRGVGHFARDRREGGVERVVLQAFRRCYEGYPDDGAKALRLVMLQRRPGGWTEVLPGSFDDDGFAIGDYPEPVSEPGYAVSCPIRGLVRMVPPTAWIEQANLALGVLGAVLVVEVPSGGRRKAASRYHTDRITEAGAVRMGEALPLSGAIRIVQLRQARADRLMRRSAPQRLFGAHESDKDDLTGAELAGMRAEAESYVASLVAGALRRVVFVDPDFGTRELLKYAFRVMRDGVEVTVLTGGPHMRKGRPDDGDDAAATEGQAAPSPMPGVGMLALLREVQGLLGTGAPKVLVMPGSRRPLFHDRFLVIDDAVWASGPSFNELGERVGMSSRVHEPRIVIAAVERALARSTALADFIDSVGPAGPNRDGLDVADI